MGHIDLADLNWERRPYKQWPAYGQSKLANLLFVLELQRRLARCRVATCGLWPRTPAWSRTNLQGHSGNAIADRATLVVTKVIGQSPRQGAWPTLFAATEDLPGGSYVGPERPQGGARPSTAGRPDRRSERSRAGAGPLDGLGGADRRALPALSAVCPRSE